MNKYEVLEMIGEGTYGVVVKAINRDTKDIVAIKKFKDNSKHFVKRELKMLNCLKSCEFIVTLKEAYRRKEKIYFIFEYVDKSLLQLLQDNPNGLNQNLAMNLLFQLCKAVERCHSLDIIHRDIKPENLLVDKSYNLKLCDFGFARHTNEHNDPYTEYVATRWYRSPELLLCCSYDKPVDIWAIGCLAAELTNGKPLFPGNSDLDQLHKIMLVLGPISEYQLEESKKYEKYNQLKISRFERITSLEKKFSHIMDPKLLDFTKACLMLNPKYRLKINECINHPALETHLKFYIKKTDQKQLKSFGSFSAYKPNGRRESNTLDLKNKSPFDIFDNNVALNSKFSNNRTTPILTNLTNNVDFSNSIESKSKFNEILLKKNIDNKTSQTQQNQIPLINSMTSQLISSKCYGSNDVLFDGNSNTLKNKSQQIITNEIKQKNYFLNEILNFKNDRNPSLISSKTNQINNNLKQENNTDHFGQNKKSNKIGLKPVAAYVKRSKSTLENYPTSSSSGSNKNGKIEDNTNNRRQSQQLNSETLAIYNINNLIMSDHKKAFPHYLKSQTLYNNFDTRNNRYTPDLERSSSNQLPKRYLNNIIKSSNQRQQYSRLKNRSQQGYYVNENGANIASSNEDVSYSSILKLK